MRTPSIYNDRRERLDIKMMPMIDVVFLLLIFFVWTANFQVVEHLLPSSVSAVTGASPQNPPDLPDPNIDFEQVVVRIVLVDGEVGWAMNDSSVESLDQLRERLNAIARIKNDAPVILHPDQQVPLGHVIDVYDISRLVGFQEVQFAASQPL